LRLNPQSDLNVDHARHRFGDVFCAALILTAVDCAGKYYFAVNHLHVDLRSVEVIIVGQTIVDIFLDALVGSLIAFRTTSAMLTTCIHAASAFSFFVSKPRSHCVRSAIPPAAFSASTVTAAFLSAVVAVFAGTIAAAFFSTTIAAAFRSSLKATLQFSRQ
jgi:hypothetical protein